MAYTPYKSDAPPPPPEEWQIPTPKRWPWITALVLIVGGLAFAIHWVTRPEPELPPSPPLATIPLPDGTELRLVGTIKGGSFNVTSDSDFEGRVRWDNGNRRRGGFGGARYGSSRSGIGGGTNDSVWLIFSHYDPATRTFSRPELKDCFASDTDKRVRHNGKAHKHGGNSLPPVVGVVFEVVPRREKELKLSFSLNGRAMEAAIPNPFLDTTSAPFTAKPLPQTAEKEGVTVEFKSAKVNVGKASEDGQTWDRYNVNTDITAKEPAVEGAKFNVARSFFDATGNKHYSFLTLDDKVWGVRVSVTEREDYPFPPDRILSLGKTKVPEPGSLTALTLPKKLAEAGLTEAMFFSPGQYQFENGQITAGGKVLARISHSRRNNQNFNEYGLGFFSTTGNGMHSLGAVIRIRRGEEILSASSRGSSSNGSDRYEEYGYVRSRKSNKGLNAGEEVEVEVIFPKTREVEFYFERPPLPETK